MKRYLKQCPAHTHVHLIFCLLLISLVLSSCKAPIYETSNIADYGKITGNYDNDTPRKIIFSFFPAQIEGYFSDVVYYYKAKEMDTYGCEAYLEFTIADKDQFLQYLNDLNIPRENIKSFDANNAFNEYTADHSLMLRKMERPQCWSIGYSKVCKILYSNEQQKIIFWAFLVSDGGGTTTWDLNYFFERFNISPDTYATRLIS